MKTSGLIFVIIVTKNDLCRQKTFILKFINSDENSTFKKTEYVGIYFGIVGLIQNFVAFVFVKFFGYVCISDFFKEFNQLVKFFSD